MYVIDTATTSLLSPYVFPVEDLPEMLIHFEAELPSMMHLPVSLDYTLHFYRYLCTHILFAEEQFLLLIDIPIWVHSQQHKIYQVFNLLIPKVNLSACYDIDTKYLGISYDETKAIEISEQQFTTCQQVIGKFCNIDTSLQSLTNAPSCITAIYTKDKAKTEHWCSLQIRNTCSATIPTPITSNLDILPSATKLDPARVTLICPDKATKSIKVQIPIHVLHLAPACSATSQHFHLPPQYINHQIKINISLNTANLNTMNISSPGFWVWQHLDDHWNMTQLHKLADEPTGPVAYLYKLMVDNNKLILPFNLADESTDDRASIWTLFSHTGICVTAIGLLMPAGLWIFCCYFFWCQHANLLDQVLSDILLLMMMLRWHPSTEAIARLHSLF